TIMFVLGIFVFKEPFSIDQLITFIFIWTGIVLYSLSQYIKLKKHPVAKTL
ncbi:EamA family transporter RarD, partial [Staphylococcus aureus]